MLQVGSAPTQEYAVVQSVPGIRALGPDPGIVVLDAPLANGYGVGGAAAVVSFVTPASVTGAPAGARATQLVLDMPAGSASGTVTWFTGWAQGAVIAVTLADGTVCYNRLAAKPVCMMMEGAGFEVFDIGINNGVEKYLEAIEKHQPEILGMSALLTTTMPYMKVVIDTLKEKGMRNDYIVLVGGAPLNEAFATPSAPTPIVATRRSPSRPPSRCSRAGRAPPRRRALTLDKTRSEPCRSIACKPTRRTSSEHFARRVDGARRVLVIACGALAREILTCATAPLGAFDVTCLPAQFHNRPERIPEAVRGKIRANRAGYDEIFCLYGDCGTGGELDRVLEEEGVARIAGPHCYAFYAGEANFDAMMEAEPGSSSSPISSRAISSGWSSRALGSIAFRNCATIISAHYRRLVYLAQTDDDELDAMAEAGARRLGLDLRAALHRLWRASSGRSSTSSESRRWLAMGRPDHPSLLARHPEPGHRQGGPAEREARIAGTLHPRHRRRRDARGRFEHRRLSRGLAPRRPRALWRRSRGRGERGGGTAGGGIR